MQIIEVEKNAKEKVRVSIEEYHGHKFIDCRVYYQDSQGEWRPTKKGIALNADCINEVIQGLQKASRKLEEALSFKTGTSVRKAIGKNAEPSTESTLPVSGPVLTMLCTIGAGQSMSRKDLQKTLKVCDKSLRRYIGQALKGRYIQVEGRGPEQRIRVIELPTRSDKTDCPEMSKSPNAENWTGETITDDARVVKAAHHLGVTAETVGRLA